MHAAAPAPSPLLRQLVQLVAEHVPREVVAGLMLELIAAQLGEADEFPRRRENLTEALAPAKAEPSNLGPTGPKSAAPWWGTNRRDLGTRTATGRKRRRARKVPGRKPGRPRKPPIVAKANGKEQENLSDEAPGSEIAVPGNGAKAEPVVLRFWRAAEALDPGRPWRAVSDHFGVNLAQAQDAHRVHALPVGVSETAAAAFI